MVLQVNASVLIGTGVASIAKVGADMTRKIRSNNVILKPDELSFDHKISTPW